MIVHPETVLASESNPEAYTALLLEAYRTLLAAIASYEPEALARATASIEDETCNRDTTPPAAVLAHSWLAFSGNQPTDPVEDATTDSFAFPATLAFDMVGRGGKRGAQRRGNAAIAALLAADKPLCSLPGPFPGHPEILNVEIWPGSFAGKRDELKVEVGG